MAPPRYVDRSNTNWAPWPRLAKVMSHNAQVVFGVSMILGGAGLIMLWRRKVGKFAFVPLKSLGEPHAEERELVST